ncbi:MAG: branched-chain amino acid ABC transporter permease [Candidatus Bathyarchaeota archaeon]|nr:branched-chain amino acid ABC transporter permease [Candidatus Bathyarchaeota archaeon]
MAQREKLRNIFGWINQHPMYTLAIILIIMPWVMPSFTVSTDMLIFGLFAMGYNILLGQTGILSFGHSVFFGLGAYGTAMFLMKPQAVPRVPASWGMLGILTGLALATAAALGIGALSLRRKGTYFSLITVAFNMMVYFIFIQNPLDLTGGGDGIIGIPTPPLFFLEKWRTPETWYYFCMVITLAAVAILRIIQNSPFGEVLKGIRENEERVMLLGYDVARYKLISFTLSGLFSGLAGSLLAFHLNFVGYDTLYWMVSGEVLIICLLGGFRTFFGPLVGAIAYILLKDGLSAITENWMIFMGVAVMAIILAFRGSGILEMAEKRIYRGRG